jgi:hypothetical protein
MGERVRHERVGGGFRQARALDFGQGEVVKSVLRVDKTSTKGGGSFQEVLQEITVKPLEAIDGRRLASGRKGF